MQWVHFPRGKHIGGVESRQKGQDFANRSRSHADAIAVSILLFLLSSAIYLQVRSFDFVNFDDPEAVASNDHVRDGLTAMSLLWAFTSTENANWAPLSRLSHLVDVQLFGMNPGWHHSTNLLLHGLAAMLLFAFLYRATGALWPSAWVAAIFALHPLHVESVAWVSARKDVLSAVFAMLALISYARYVECPTWRRNLLVCVFLALGLLAKPILVTFPFVLLLLDIWPLHRIRDFSWLKAKALLVEKLPLLALSAAAASVTYLVQTKSGAVASFEAFPPLLRIENALVSSVVYLWQALWPTNLAAFYPYPDTVPVWQAVACGVVLAAISLFVLRCIDTRAYLAVGWLWYLIMLVPVIGLVQAGAQAHADRYMYLPLIGLAIMLAWGGSELVDRARRARIVLTILGAASCAACATLTWHQTAYWRDSATLFQHAIDVTSLNYLAEHNLGVALATDPAQLNAAILHYRSALAIKPNDARTHGDLGRALLELPGHRSEAVNELRIAVGLNPRLAALHNNVAMAWARSGRWNDAMGEYQTARNLDPDYDMGRRQLAELHSEFGIALASSGRGQEAIPEFEAALRISDTPAFHNNLGIALAQMGRENEAIAEFEAALRIDPRLADAEINLGLALSAIPGRLSDAIRHLEAADRLRPDPKVRKRIESLQNHTQ